MLKKSLYAVILLFSFVPLFSQVSVKKVERGEEAWRYLIKAEDAYDCGDFSKALEYAEIASSRQKQEADWEMYTLENLYKKAVIRNADDDISEMMILLQELELKEPLEIIKKRVDFYGKDFFGSSFSGLIEKEKFFSRCPEADYIISKIYRLEGESELSIQYLMRAYEYSANLKLPAKKYDILYDLADTAYDTGDWNEYEKYLLTILKDNPYYTDADFMNALVRIVDSDEKENVEKFFLLYRNQSYQSFKALSLLCRYYNSRGEDLKSIKCAALGSIVAVTKIDEALKNRITAYSYESFAKTIYSAGRQNDIMEWGNNSGVWELFYSFAVSCSSYGKLTFGTELLKILSKNLPDSYWQKRCESALLR
ncbi:MAG: hypothetical protein J5780_00475 [Treponema sp.]|nr:hypothetical protein [Treponema sp.]